MKDVLNLGSGVMSSWLPPGCTDAQIDAYYGDSDVKCVCGHFWEDHYDAQNKEDRTFVEEKKIVNEDGDFAYESCNDAKCDCRQWYAVREVEPDYEDDAR